MQVRYLPRALRLASALHVPELSPIARARLHALTVWQDTGDWRLATKVFGLSRATLYRWRRRYGPADLTTLESRSRRPRQVRRSQTPAPVVARLCQLRQQYPRWGREKLRILLRREGLTLSGKTIDRVLTRLRATGQLVEPPRRTISARRRSVARPYAVRKPRDYAVRHPGDLLQVDTLDVRPLPGVILKQFTARDVVSRWDVVETYGRATSVTATQFLATLHRRMPMPIRAIQVDGGSEFAAAFEQACQQQGIRLFVLPAPLPSAERPCGTRESHPHGGVLRVLHRRVRSLDAASRPTAVGTHLQCRPTASSARLFDTRRISRALCRPRPAVSHVMTPYSSLQVLRLFDKMRRDRIGPTNFANKLHAP